MICIWVSTNRSDTSRENRVVKCNSQKAGIKLPEMVIQPRRISDPTNTQQGGIPTISTCGKTNLCDMVDWKSYPINTCCNQSHIPSTNHVDIFNKRLWDMTDIMRKNFCEPCQDTPVEWLKGWYYLVRGFLLQPVGRPFNQPVYKEYQMVVIPTVQYWWYPFQPYPYTRWIGVFIFPVYPLVN